MIMMRPKQLWIDRDEDPEHADMQRKAYQSYVQTIRHELPRPLLDYFANGWCLHDSRVFHMTYNVRTATARMVLETRSIKKRTVPGCGRMTGEESVEPLQLVCIFQTVWAFRHECPPRPGDINRDPYYPNYPMECYPRQSMYRQRPEVRDTEVGMQRMTSGKPLYGVFLLIDVPTWLLVSIECEGVSVVPKDPERLRMMMESDEYILPFGLDVWKASE